MIALLLDYRIMEYIIYNIETCACRQIKQMQTSYSVEELSF